MATIYDVATAAGVSISTVSKYLNNAGYINPAKRDSIKEAISMLNYTPNRAAKQLKTGLSKDIAVVIPNMSEKVYVEALTSINAILQKEGFRTIVFITNDVVENEQSILDSCVGNEYAGIILCTCQPDNSTLFKKILQIMPMIFFLREPTGFDQYNFIGFDNGSAIYAIAKEMIELNYGNLFLYIGDKSFSNEKEAMDSFILAHHDLNQEVDYNTIFSYPVSRESTFRNVMELFNTIEFPVIFITTSYVTAQAISEVAFFRDLVLGEDFCIFTLGESTWYEGIFFNKIIATFRDARRLGALTAQGILEFIKNPKLSDPIYIRLDDNFPLDRVKEYFIKNKKNWEKKVWVNYHKTLKILINESDTSTNAILSLIPQFKKQEHIDVDLQIVPHQVLYDKIKHMAINHSKEYDIFSVDTPWLPYLNSLNGLYDLSNYARFANLKQRMQPHVLERIGTCDNKILGIPYTYSSSLLFYRRDLFESPDHIEDFYAKHKTNLAPPTNWHEYNMIARYFTRKYNPSSPTEYGTNVFGGYSEALCTELYPRIWAYNGGIFDRFGRVAIRNHNVYRAYSNLVETIHCSNPLSLSYKAFDGLDEFAKGNVAMVCHFCNNATRLVDRANTKIWHGIGYAPMPSKTSVDAGWSLAVNDNSDNKLESTVFLDWFFSTGLSMSYTILGGTSPMKQAFEDEKIMSLYPWMTLTKKHFHEGTSRQLPRFEAAEVMDSQVIDSILASVVYNHFEKGIDLKEGIHTAYEALCKYAESNGFPKNLLD